MNNIESVCTLEFSSERKCMSTVVNGYRGERNNQVLLKGAPERVLDKCTKIMHQDGSQTGLSETNRKLVKEKIKKVAGQGYRVLGVGIALDGGNMKKITA